MRYQHNRQHNRQRYQHNRQRIKMNTKTDCIGGIAERGKKYLSYHSHPSLAMNMINP